ncbi:MAG: hypothetical protein ACRBB0_26260 [Pelagimonas sp.]|uniref:hypothetical protein n=1 Tax=Pelagimonas sp. TaxID=2073170 RepID=UPI003D6C50A6
MMLKDGQTCYVVMPKHVAGDSRRVTVFSANPVQHSRATVETPFWDGLDLAIGVVRGKVEERCSMSLSDFDHSMDTADGGKVHLIRLSQSGEMERVEMLVTKTEYLHLEAQVISSLKELYKGSSGSFLFDGDKPIGMIVQARSAKEGRFIRIEEIYMNLKRRINRRKGFRFIPDTTSVALKPSAPEKETSFFYTHSTLASIVPKDGPENLQGDGSYIFDLTRSNRIAFRVRGHDAVALSKVKVISTTEGGYAIPREIDVDVSSVPNGSRPRPFLSGEMGPDGIFTLSRSPTVARWVFVTINSSWDRGPVGIASITFN